MAREDIGPAVDAEDGKKDNDMSGMDLDTILVEELGQFGWYQLRTASLALLLAIFSAWAAVEYIFTTARISTRCLIPECESLSSPAEFAPGWLANAVPPSGSAFDNCQRFANISSNWATNQTCPATLFDQSNLVSCESYIYQNTETVVYDFDLGCDDWRRSLIGSVRTVGVLAALPLTGFVSDRWGRRPALALNAINTAWLGLLRYFADTYVGFLISEFMEAFLGSGGFTCAYIIMIELLGPKFRVAGGACMNTFFAIGQVTMALIAWGVPTWRNLTLALYAPQLITISYFWIVTESVRWYISKGRYDDADKVLKEVARVNGKQLSEKSLQALRENAEAAKKREELEQQTKVEEPWLIVEVFRSKPILLRCMLSPIWWITTTFIYYGLSINSANLSGNRYLNYMAVAAVEIPGFWISFLLLGRIGRKPVLVGGFWVCAACQIAYIFIPDGNYGASLSLYLIGKCSIACVMTAIYVYTAELFPTRHRHSLLAFASMMGRIGSILAPLTPALGSAVWESLPFVLFGALALLSGCLVCITPETLGSRLPDTMAQASDIGRKNSTPS